MYGGSQLDLSLSVTMVQRVRGTEGRVVKRLEWDGGCGWGPRGVQDLKKRSEFINL